MLIQPALRGGIDFCSGRAITTVILIMWRNEPNHMGSPDMTSVSVSFEVRRLLNSLKSIEGEASVDTLLKTMLKEHRMNRLGKASDALRKRIGDLDEAAVEKIVSSLGLAPW